VTDIVDPAIRSQMMAGIKSKDTKPEVFLRKALHAKGLRYRLGGGCLPGKPDLVFPARKTVIFVHGCFWHKHECNHFKWPESNQEFWKNKLDANAARDLRVSKELKALGWRVLTVWECELKKTGYKLPNTAINHVLVQMTAMPTQTGTT
jgi:DNA mismatch endonuclease (patch repair protein)